jgi:hypothetical protein
MEALTRSYVLNTSWNIILISMTIAMTRYSVLNCSDIDGRSCAKEISELLVGDIAKIHGMPRHLLPVKVAYNHTSCW